MQPIFYVRPVLASNRYWTQVSCTRITLDTLSGQARRGIDCALMVWHPIFIGWHGAGGRSGQGVALDWGEMIWAEA